MDPAPSSIRDLLSFRIQGAVNRQPWATSTQEIIQAMLKNYEMAFTVLKAYKIKIKQNSGQK